MGGGRSFLALSQEPGTRICLALEASNNCAPDVGLRTTSCPYQAHGKEEGKKEEGKGAMEQLQGIYLHIKG